MSLCHATLLTEKGASCATTTCGPQQRAGVLTARQNQ